LRPAQGNNLRDIHLQNNQTKNELVVWSKQYRVPALQVQNPELKPQFTKKEKKKKYLNSMQT
jgi:hypothetical protein